MDEAGVFIRRGYIALLDGDILAALMLSQIVYWYLPEKKTGKAKLRVPHEGKYWLAKSHKGWFDECGFSQDQTRRCLKVLKDRGIVEVKTFKFDGAPTVHVRLCIAYGKNKLKVPPRAEELHVKQVGGADVPAIHLGPSPNPFVLQAKPITETTTETTTDIHSSVNANGGDMKADEILKQHKTKASTGSLPAFWQKRRALISSGFQKHLTGKDIGQLKMLQSALGDQTRAVIDVVLGNWLKFASRAGAAAGTPYPTEPSIGFLLLHHDVAADMMTPKKTAVQSIAQVVVKPVYDSSVSEEEKPHKMTKQELAEMLASFEE